MAVMGQTASGKTDLAEFIADAWGAVLVNADAFQMYRGMDIGTAKPADPSRYQLMNTLDPNEEYGVGEFAVQAQQILSSAYAERRDVVIVGGTGLYIRALMDEWQDMQAAPDPALRTHLDAQSLEDLVGQLPTEKREGIDLQNKARVRRALERHLSPTAAIRISLPPFRKFKIALDWPVDEINSRIDRRVEIMWETGWPDEVLHLMKKGFDERCFGFRAIGYSQIAQFLRGGINEGVCRELIQAQTRAYAKRQRTWLRSEKGLVLGSPSPSGEWTEARIDAAFDGVFKLKI